MPKPIATEERLLRARGLIQKAREITPPADTGWDWLSYTASVKDVLRQARDLLKFLPMTAGVTPAQKADAQIVMQEIIDAEKSILHKSSQ